MKCEQKIAIVVFFTAYSNRLSLFLIKWFYSRFVTEIQNYYKHTNPKIYVYFIIVSSRNFSVVGHIKFCVCDEEEKKYLRLYYEESCSTRIYELSRRKKMPSNNSKWKQVFREKRQRNFVQVCSGFEIYFLKTKISR